MKLRWAVLLISIIYVFAFFSHAWHLKRTVYGDGVFYYSWLRSIVIDHDIDFSNEYAYNQVTQPKTSSGLAGNKYSIGPALLWAPAYISMHNLVRGNGWSLSYQLAVGISSVLSVIVGLILLIRILKTAPAVSSLTILLVAGATNLFFYGSIDPVNSHAVSFFASVVYVAFVTSTKKNWFIIGLTLALIASIRLHDVLYVVALVPFWKRIRWHTLIGGFIVGFVPQLVAWYALYGSLANPYLTGGETFDFFRPHILGVLFGASSGLFLWTPIVAVGVAGLILEAKKHWAYLTIFALQLYLIASWSTWWQGASVSGRMFVSTLPLIAIGLGHIMALLYKRRLMRSTLPLLVLAITLINAIGIFYYLFTY